jgi:hypothetical protein
MVSEAKGLSSARQGMLVDGLGKLTLFCHRRWRAERRGESDGEGLVRSWEAVKSGA